jgi:hypothetical protein
MGAVRLPVYFYQWDDQFLDDVTVYPVTAYEVEN